MTGTFTTLDGELDFSTYDEQTLPGVDGVCPWMGVLLCGLSGVLVAVAAMSFFI